MRACADKQKPAGPTKSANSTSLGRAFSSPDDEVHSIIQLQRKFGNQAVQRLLHADAENLERRPGVAATTSVAQNVSQTRTTVERYPFLARIRRGPRALLGGQVQAAQSRSDSPPGQEHGGEEYLALFEQLSAIPAGATAPESQFAAVPESPELGTTSGEASSGQAAGVPIQVPDIEVPALAELAKSDAVMAKFKYTGSITRGGATPAGFGVTRSFSSKLTGATITPKSGTFEVAATFEHPITYQIRSGTGPSGQVDIAAETDTDITKTNYPTVVSDLTPNMSDLNGRPPRTTFWAEDLTVRHELVHANDDKKNGPGAMATVTTWLNGQTAANVGEVNTLLGALPGRFAAALLAALSTVDGEKHAYGDGAPSYKARADAIKAKGDKGEYK